MVNASSLKMYFFSEIFLNVNLFFKLILLFKVWKQWNLQEIDDDDLLEEVGCLRGKYGERYIRMQEFDTIIRNSEYHNFGNTTPLDIFTQPRVDPDFNLDIVSMPSNSRPGMNV